MKREGRFYKWSEEDDRYLTEHYSTTEFKAIAAHLGVRYTALQTRCNRLLREGKLNKRQRYYHPRWERWEIDYLKERFGQVQDRTICAKLKRSMVGVRLKAKRLGLVKKMNILSLDEIARIFKLDAHKVRKWIYDGKLMARRGPFKQGPYHVWIVEYGALEAFIKNEPNEYDPRRVDREEYPGWHKLVMKYGFPNEEVKFPRAWEPWAVQYIIDNYPKLGAREMAPVLRRSVAKVSAKITDLREKGLLQGKRKRGVYCPNLWTAWEDKFLAAHYGKLKYKEIGMVLGRTEGSCAARMAHHKKTGEAERLTRQYQVEMRIA